MEPFHFTCPYCLSRLRLREQMFVGRQVACPECAGPLLIVQAKQGLSVSKSAPDEQPVAAVESKLAARKGLVAPSRSAAESEPSAATATSLLGRWLTPRVIGWACAIGVATTGWIAVSRTSRPSASIVPLAAPTPATPPLQQGDAKLAHGARQQPADKPDSHPEVPSVAAGATPSAASRPARTISPPRSDAEEHLSQIGAELLARLQTDGHFPAATIASADLRPHNRFGWMANLSSALAPQSKIHVDWGRPWQAPQNDAFARRRIYLYQNLAISQLTGSDGYPAAHFAGVAGVGKDARSLPKQDPRAGIFGDDRQTTLEDIVDGASNTMMVAGVQDHLGSWASGDATVRSFTAPPYVNGPDGFGTGQTDSMFVLMADGSVKPVPARTDPVIVRRMAAMADHLPLDIAVMGEPGDARKPILLAPDPPIEQTAQAAPAPPPMPAKPMPMPRDAAPPAPVIVDFDALMQQKIARFDQSKPVPLIEVLHIVAEMGGLSINFDPEEIGTAAAGLAKPVTLRLEKTTVGEILDKLLNPVDLGYHFEQGQIRIVPRKSGVIENKP